MMSLLAWWAALDPTFRVVVLFAAATAVANWLTAPDDPAEWDRIKREEPRRAGAILMLRGFGIYPAKILRGAVLVWKGGKS